MDVSDIISWVLFVSGGVFVFIGGLGAIRLPNFYTRLHAASLTDSMGSLSLGGERIRHAEVDGNGDIWVLAPDRDPETSDLYVVQTGAGE